MRLMPIVLLAAIALALPAAAQAQGALVTPLERATPLSTHDGWLLFSRFTGGAYRLVARNGDTERVLPVAPQATPFDADAGPDSRGNPSAVVSVCAGSCDLFVVGFEAGDELRPVRNANTRDRDEVAPSVWRGRLVFGRRYGEDRVVPYTKELVAPRSRPSDRLAGLPARRCGAVDPPRCRPLEEVTLVRQDLWGRWVGQSWTHETDGFGGFRQNEIRLTDVRRTDTRQVAAMTTGLSGQTYLGPSLGGGYVAFFRACQGDPAACQERSGAIRYRISTGGAGIVEQNRAWEAWALEGTTGFHVPSGFDCSGGDPGSPPRQACGIYRQDGLDFEPIAADRLR